MPTNATPDYRLTLLEAKTATALLKKVATLPKASNNTGAKYMVSDSTVAASGNYGAIVVGGGSNTVAVYSDGTHWRIG